MRETKFRAWDKHKKEMIYNSNQSCFDPQVNVGWELLQYTGLKDKNGKEIYEGDIVKTKFEDVKSLVMIFRDGGFCPSGDKFKRRNLGIIPDNSLCNGCEIIGNIYENPELEVK